MTGAFKCDNCGKYFDGSPAARLRQKVTEDGGRANYPVIADVCYECGTEFNFGIDLNEHAHYNGGGA